MESPPDLDQFIDELGGICSAAAQLFLDGLTPSLERDPTPQWIWDRDQWRAQLGTEDPAGLVNEIASTYLAEAAQQVCGVSVLLHTRQISATLDPLTRAIIERAGIVRWILDPTITPTQRAARSYLEFGVSLQHYRQALERLRASKSIRTSHRDLDHQIQARILELFDVEREPVDPGDPASIPTTDLSRWIVSAEIYPTLTAVAQIALASDGLSRGRAAGTYGGLSGFAHPSIWFSRETTRTTGGTATAEHRPQDLEKTVRYAAFGFLAGAHHWSVYYDAELARFLAGHARLEHRLNSITVLDS